MGFDGVGDNTEACAFHLWAITVLPVSSAPYNFRDIVSSRFLFVVWCCSSRAYSLLLSSGYGLYSALQVLSVSAWASSWFSGFLQSHENITGDGLAAPNVKCVWCPAVEWCHMNLGRIHGIGFRSTKKQWAITHLLLMNSGEVNYGSMFTERNSAQM